MTGLGLASTSEAKSSSPTISKTFILGFGGVGGGVGACGLLDRFLLTDCFFFDVLLFVFFDELVELELLLLLLLVVCSGLLLTTVLVSLVVSKLGCSNVLLVASLVAPEPYKRSFSTELRINDVTFPPF
jgi:hypothetical protein